MPVCCRDGDISLLEAHTRCSGAKGEADRFREKIKKTEKMKGGGGGGGGEIFCVVRTGRRGARPMEQRTVCAKWRTRRGRRCNACSTHVGTFLRWIAR